jgi:hypothetical protein
VAIKCHAQKQLQPMQQQLTQRTMLRQLPNAAETMSPAAAAAADKRLPFGTTLTAAYAVTTTPKSAATYTAPQALATIA